jgi:hypothetical protein
MIVFVETLFLFLHLMMLFTITERGLHRDNPCEQRQSDQGNDRVRIMSFLHRQFGCAAGVIRSILRESQATISDRER